MLPAPLINCLYSANEMGATSNSRCRMANQHSRPWHSQQSQQLDSAGGCNAFKSRDLEIGDAVSIPTAPTIQLIDKHRLPI